MLINDRETKNDNGNERKAKDSAKSKELLPYARSQPKAAHLLLP
jgi:hypothetical protein